MESKKQQNRDSQAEAKDTQILTPQQVQKRKKMVIFPLFFLAFAGCMWLIFAPTEEPEQSTAGFNTELPTPEIDGILSDKRAAYMQEDFARKHEAKIRSLQDFALASGASDEDFGQEEAERTVAPLPSGDGVNPHDAFRTSQSVYADINRQLGSFYEDISGEEEQEKQELQARIEELERRLSEEQTGKAAQEEQMALLEKSYEIAARYMNGGQASARVETVEATAAPDKASALQPVRQVRKHVVSRLTAPMSDSAFLTEFAQPRNWGFNTVSGHEGLPERNTIRACISRTVAVTDGGDIPLRLLEPVMAGEDKIPANTSLTGSARIDGNRLRVTVNALQYEGRIIPVELSAYDMDGCEGIAAPVSDEINAVKEIAANMGSGIGSSITITDDAGMQLLSDLGRSAIQGTAQYIGQKMRQVKVTLKAGYEVLLAPPQE